MELTVEEVQNKLGYDEDEGKIAKTQIEDKTQQQIAQGIKEIISLEKTDQESGNDLASIIKQVANKELESASAKRFLNGVKMYL